MIKVKILGERVDYRNLQNDVNEFLSSCNGTIVDIKYSSAGSIGLFLYSAMIVYKDKT